MASSTTFRRILAIAIIAAFAVWFFRSPDVESDKREVTRYYLRGEYHEAEKSANRLLKHSPDLEDVRMMAANCAARRGNVQQALKHLSLLHTNNRKVRLKAALLEADLAGNRLFDLRRTESACRAALQIDPDNVTALETLVRLLAVCGRRREALPSLTRLVGLRSSSDLLTIAARGSGAINDAELLGNAQRAFPDDSRVLMGLALHAESSGDLETAIALCRKAVTNEPSFAPATVALGHYLLEADRFEDLEDWTSRLSPDCLTFAEAWRIRAHVAEHQGDLQVALDCFLHAGRLGPELRNVHHGTSRLLRKAGDTQAADLFSIRLQKTQQLESQQDRMFAAGPGQVVVLVTMIELYREVGRFWEAYGWTQIGLGYQPDDTTLRALHSKLAKETRTLDLDLVAKSHNIALRISANDYTLPRHSFRPQNSAPTATSTATCPFSFRNDADAIGLEFTYINGVVGPTTHRMFESTGGGIGVCDFDRDDFPDLFFSQGHVWAADRNPAAEQDSLFRNIRGRAFVDVTSTTGISAPGFGQGVAVGDIDGDGFPDIFVGNIGPNHLWRNNGDGTFDDNSLRMEGAGNDRTWTTSALIADLNNNGAADIYAANYLSGHDLFDRICGSVERPRACIPAHFDGVCDHLYLNDGHGALNDASEKLAVFDRGKGLGVAAWSPGNDGRLSVLVTNDTTPNMMLSFGSGVDADVTERAFAAGLAVNAQGKAEGCMGIAIGDVDNNGFADAFVTNFYNETNTFYECVDGTFFEDQTRRMNLAAASLPVLGFGTQFLDANLDGRLELLVVNGHVDDLQSQNTPYQMPAQFFSLQGGAFVQVPADRLGEYFLQDRLGRSAACLDWNRDGLVDVAIGHLSENYTLLTNTCSGVTPGVTVRFVGASSSRDAVGVTASWPLGDTIITRQITAGDGYQASSQHELWLACDVAGKISTLTVVWPSGHVQTFMDLSGGTRCVIREDDDRCLALP